MRFLLLLFSLLAVKNGCLGLFFQTAYTTLKSVIKCDYQRSKQFGVRFFCKDRNFTCDEILSTKSALKKNGTFSLTTTRSGFNVFISKVSPRDEGVYGCGLNKRGQRIFVKKIQLKVKAVEEEAEAGAGALTPAAEEAEEEIFAGETALTPAVEEEAEAVPPPPPRSPMRTPQSTTSSLPQTDGGSQVMTAAIVCGAVVMLLLGLILIFIYKRSSHSRNSRNEAADQHIREDCVYEEIQGRIRKKDSENKVETVYAPTNFPTNPSALLHYSSIDFHHSSDKAAGGPVILKSSSACEYSTVKCGPTYCAANAPSRRSEDPLYSNVNRPK